MKRAASVLVAILIAGGLYAQARQPGSGATRDLVGTWTLVSTETNLDADRPTTAPNPRGVLIIDGGGNIFETITRGGNRLQPVAPAAQTDPVTIFASYSGFWGRYTANAAEKKITLRPAGAVSPNVMGSEFSRTYDVRGDLLVVSAPAGEPHTRVATRWTWERVPIVENLSPGYRQVVGFWEHVFENRVNLTTGVTTPDTARAPSVIVYTPSGYVGVHFPPVNRPRFAGAEPTPEEAAAAIRGYVGYFGALGVYPGMVFHQILAGISPAQGTTLKRFYELKGTDLNIRFPVTRNQQGQETTTLVKLKRLSGEKEMLR
jgi:hypothetical protein